MRKKVIYGYALAGALAFLVQPAYSDPADDDTQTQDKPASLAEDFGNYPQLTAKESQLLGSTHLGESVETRLERLEKNASGKISTGDLNSRLKALDKFAPPSATMGGRRAGSGYTDPSGWVDDPTSGSSSTMNPPPGWSNPYSQGSRHSQSGSYGMGTSGGGGIGGGGSFGMGGGAGLIYPDDDDMDNGPAPQRNFFGQAPQQQQQPQLPALRHPIPQELTILEKKIFGKDHSGDNLPDRVSALEAAVFSGSAQPNVAMSLPDRVRRLLAAVDGPANTNNNRADSLAQNQQNGQRSRFSQLGNALSNMGNGMNSTTIYSSGFPGMGMGGMGMYPQTYPYGTPYGSPYSYQLPGYYPNRNFYGYPGVGGYPTGLGIGSPYGYNQFPFGNPLGGGMPMGSPLGGSLPLRLR